MITINVIIPVYNAEKYIESAVLSIINQNIRYRILLVDDGSSDLSPTICDNLKASYEFIDVIHKENEGVSSARNTGINYFINLYEYNKEDFNYIAFLDADDLWIKNFFSKEIIGILQKEYDLVGFNTINCNNSATKCTHAKQLDEGLHILNQDESIWLLEETHFGAVFYSLKILKNKQIYFDENLNYSEDKIFRMQCLYQSDTVYLKNKILYLYRSNDTSVMNNRPLGFVYYASIIEGWIDSDLKMNEYVTDKFELSGGRVLACIYIQDAIDEELMTLNSAKKVNAKLNNPKYKRILKEFEDNEFLVSRYNLYKEYQKRYILKMRIKGIARLLKIFLLKIPFIKKYTESIKYPNCIN